jgi:hypothetical protein
LANKNNTTQPRQPSPNRQSKRHQHHQHHRHHLFQPFPFEKTDPSYWGELAVLSKIVLVGDTNTKQRGNTMAKKYTLGTEVSLHDNAGAGDVCALCSKRLPSNFSSFQVEWSTMTVIDWTDDRDFNDHEEYELCEKCEDKFDDSLIIR